MPEQQILPRGANATAAPQLLELGAAYANQVAAKAMTRRAPVPCFEYSELFGQLYANPITRHNLKRSNWKHIRPRLNVEISINPQDCLVIDVFPWEEESAQGRESRNLNFQNIGDFNYFFPRGAAGQSPPNQVLCLPLERTFIASFSPPEALSLRATDEHQTTARKMCALLVKAKLHQLSLCFDCRLLTSMVCYGPRNFLEIRSLEPVEDSEGPVLSEYVTQGLSIESDPRLSHLCKKYHVMPDTLTHFAHHYWIPHVPEALRRQTLAEYLDEPQAHLVTEEDAASLFRVCQPTAELAKHMLQMDEDHDALFQFLSTRGSAWPEKFQTVFGLDADIAFDWIFLNHQIIFDEMEVSGAYLRQKLEKRVALGDINFDHRCYLHEKLISAWDGAFRTGPLATYLQRLDAAAQELSFSSFSDLQQWSCKHSVLLLSHLVELHETAGQQLAELTPEEYSQI